MKNHRVISDYLLDINNKRIITGFYLKEQIMMVINEYIMSIQLL